MKRTIHWSELCPNNGSDGNAKSIREIYGSLRELPMYERWLTPFGRPSDSRIGQKIAEGGLAEIFEAVSCDKKHRQFNYVLKVFKKGFSLQDQKSQWLEDRYPRDLFWGCMIMDDGRFGTLAFFFLRVTLICGS